MRATQLEGTSILIQGKPLMLGSMGMPQAARGIWILRL